MIHLEDVEKRYGELNVLRRVNLKVPPRSFISIMGSSGSGKSTLLNLIGGMDRPDGGRIIVDGQVISEFADEELTLYRRKNVGFVFQFFNLLPNITAFENIEMPLLLNGLLGGGERILSLIDLVGLKGREGAYPRQLSGGEQQRVAIARALIHDPDIILADEPTGNLDSQTGMHIMDLLHAVAKRGGKTVLLVTHDHDVAKYGETILRIRDGVIER